MRRIEGPRSALDMRAPLPRHDDACAAEAPLRRELGQTGLHVFPVGLGAMALSTRIAADPTQAANVIKAAIDAGVTFIDTANVYCPGDDIGHNERLIGKSLRALGMIDTVTVATKGGVDRPRRTIDGRPAFLRAACIASLRALGRDVITLYQLHAPDHAVPVEDSIGELARLQAEGKIVHIGICNATRDELARATRTARIESVQNACHPSNAGDYDSGLVALCEAAGISYIPHTCVGGPSMNAAVAQPAPLAAIADGHEITPQAVVIAWHLSKGRRVIPIPGVTRVASAISAAGAARLVLSAAEIAAVDSADGE